MTIKEAIKWGDEQLKDGKCSPDCPQCNAYEAALRVLIKATKPFCEECRKNANYIALATPMSAEIQGETYTYLGTQALCAECGSELYIPEIIDQNLDSLYDVYTKKNKNKE